MSRKLKSMEPGRAVHVTCNTVRGEYTFTPAPKFTERAIGYIRKYQKSHGMAVSCGTLMSTHLHLLLWPKSQTQLSDFMRDVDSALVRLTQRMYGVTGTGLAQPFVQSEDLDDEAAEHTFIYINGNSVKENLVEDPRHWPGMHSAKELCGGPAQIGVYFDNKAFAAARKTDPTVKRADFWVHEAIELTPLPQHAGLSRYQRETANRKMVQQIVREAAEVRTRPVKGPKAVQEEDPLYVPPPREERKSPVKRYKALGPCAKELIKAAREAYQAMIEAYDYAMEAFLSGRRDVPFPESCYIPLMVRKALAIP